MQQAELNDILRDPLAYDIDDIIGAEGEDAPAEQADIIDATAGVEGDEDNQAVEDTEPEAESEPEAVIKTRDGKHEIPYAVLESEREQRRQAQAMIADLQAKLAAMSTEGANAASPVADIIDDDAITALGEEAPLLAQTVRALRDRALAVERQMQQMQAERESQARTEAERRVQAAIDEVPKLLHVQTHDAAAYDEIVAIDELLRARPKWTGRPLSERFAAAVAMYEAEHGAIDLPGRPTPSKDTAPAPAPVAAAAALKRARTAAPSTLSDIPGTALPATDDGGQAIDEMSAVALTNRLMDMSFDQIMESVGRQRL